MWLFFVTQYNSSLSSFVPNFRILNQVVAERSLTKKSLQKNRQTDKHDYRKRKKTICPLYTSYRGYNYYFKETKSAAMNIFRKKKYFLFKSFVKVELSYLFTINMFTIAENCTEK